ncbi:insulinase family protein [uncultured Sunxiuqinia sp.]|uniref:M16 family metallopeptidase n=1 Tax=uncultured Sunxiuqinia sp. TaxID=1573825 RepID=UPI002AA88E7D|nr:insulinase family protein [uncultured Sunxiuqinia sp.]
MRRLKSILLLFVTLPVLAQSEFKSTDQVPLDPNVKTGVLENGMTYYIRHNEEPKDRASFYMIQNVGALLENDDQNGLAHFLEHMAFNGTENFKGKGILNTLQNHGVAFGRNINAYTAFNQTVYNLSEVPTTHDGLVDTCLLVLHDWSNYLLLTDEEIDAERGVITEEWRTRRNASFRLRNQWFPVLFKGSKWAVRDVIGDTTVIRYHTPKTLRDFYHDWYRTDLQAIAIVGDINVELVEQKVKEIFSPIPAVKDAEERPTFKIPSHDETYFVVATDEEATQSNISVFILEENNDGKPKTYEDLKNHYIQSLYNSMSGMRIQELLQKGEPPFIMGSTNISGFVRGYDTYSIAATANPNNEARALEAIMTETERIKRYGFAESELERAKTNFLTELESHYKQKDKISNDSYAREYAEYYLTMTPAPGIDIEYEFAKQLLPTITAEEVSQKAKEWIKEENRTIVITGPTDAEHLTETEAKNIIAKVESMEIKPYVDAAGGASLIDKNLKGAEIVNTKKLDAFDAVEWTLANNVKVIFRHADYEKDAVSLMAYSDGGTSKVENDMVPSAGMAQTFVSAYGVGDFDAITLQKMLTGKKVEVSPTLSSLAEGFNGSSTPKDFETLLQLVYLYFEKPRFDEEAHNALMSRYIAYISNMAKNPQKIMQDSLTYILSDYNPRVRTMNLEYLAEVDFKEIESIYKDRIQDAGDFTFFIVGNIEQEVVKELVRKYLGSLTDNDREENWVDRGIRAPEGKTDKVIPIAFETPKANVNVTYVNDIEYNQENILAMKVLKGILDLRYTESVREDEGGTYGVRVGSGLSQYPVERAQVKIMFDCDPSRTEKLKSLIYQEINKIIEEGPTDVDFNKTVSNLLKDRQQSLEHNSFWMSSLYNYYYSGINLADPANYEGLLNEMTKQDIQKFAASFFEGADLIDVVFKPKE